MCERASGRDVCGSFPTPLPLIGTIREPSYRASGISPIKQIVVYKRGSGIATAGAFPRPRPRPGSRRHQEGEAAVRMRRPSVPLPVPWCLSSFRLIVGPATVAGPSAVCRLPSADQTPPSGNSFAYSLAKRPLPNTGAFLSTSVALFAAQRSLAGPRRLL